MLSDLPSETLESVLFEVELVLHLFEHSEEVIGYFSRPVVLVFPEVLFGPSDEVLLMFDRMSKPNNFGFLLGQQGGSLHVRRA